MFYLPAASAIVILYLIDIKAVTAIRSRCPPRSVIAKSAFLSPPAQNLKPKYQNLEFRIHQKPCNRSQE
jgi:hypothetical protein